MPPKIIHTKYKKCPFCGGTPKLRGANSGMYWMQCQTCGAMTRETVTSQEAQDLWKRRVSADVNTKQTSASKPRAGICKDRRSDELLYEIGMMSEGW